eukprot:6179795-Pleurochrysis_carterae.AAC.2
MPSLDAAFRAFKGSVCLDVTLDLLAFQPKRKQNRPSNTLRLMLSLALLQLLWFFFLLRLPWLWRKMFWNCTLRDTRTIVKHCGSGTPNVYAATPKHLIALHALGQYNSA